MSTEQCLGVYHIGNHRLNICRFQFNSKKGIQLENICQFYLSHVLLFFSFIVYLCAYQKRYASVFHLMINIFISVFKIRPQFLLFLGIEHLKHTNYN